MINYFRKMFNLDKVAELESGVDALLENNKQLEAEVREYKGYKLKYQVAMLQNNEAEYLELLEMAEKVEKWESNESARQETVIRGDFGRLQNSAYQQSQLMGLGQAQMNNILGGQGGSLLAQHMAATSGRWL